MLTMFALTLSAALAQDYTNVVFGDFDGDGQTDLAIGIDGECARVDVWLSSARPAWPQPARHPVDLPMATTSVRPEACERGYGSILDVQKAQNDVLLVWSEERQVVEGFSTTVEEDETMAPVPRPCFDADDIGLCIWILNHPAPDDGGCTPCCGGGDCCIGGSCQP